MIVNCTPHEVIICGVTFPPSGVVPRVSVATHVVGNHDGVPLVKGTYGEAEGLPPTEDGTIYIVSAMVRLACPSRKDLASPADLKRDESGRIVGCGALEVS
jgi:hypothetical protein